MDDAATYFSECLVVGLFSPFKLNDFMDFFGDITEPVLLISSHSRNQMVGKSTTSCRMPRMPWEGELPSFDVDAALAALEDETNVKQTKTGNKMPKTKIQSHETNYCNFTSTIHLHGRFFCEFLANYHKLTQKN